MGQLIGLHCEPDIPGIPSWGARSSPNLIRFVHFNFAPSDAALFTSVSRFPAANLTLLSVRFVLVLFLFFFFLATVQHFPFWPSARLPITN